MCNLRGPDTPIATPEGDRAIASLHRGGLVYSMHRGELVAVPLLTVGRSVAPHGVVSGAVVGACVQIPDYDLHRLTSRVLYTDNGTNLDTTTLPIPEFD